MAAGRKLTGWNFEGRMGEDSASGRRDEVRIEVGDIDPDMNLIEDNVIAWRLSQEGNNVLKAAWRVCGDIKARFAKYTDKSGSQYNEALSQVYEHYDEMQEALKVRRGLAIPTAPQISKDRRKDLQDDTDLKKPDFSIGMLSRDSKAIQPGGSEIDDWSGEETS